MDNPTILLQLDTDPLPSVFDRVVAVDAGVQHVFSYGGVTADNVMSLVHGCIFTRGPKELHRTAIFIGGSNVNDGEVLLTAVRKHLLVEYGLSVSIMLDSNGANTTAAAAVRAAARHLDLSRTTSLVLGGTGPVGQRVARLLAKAGGTVRIGSRQFERAEEACHEIRKNLPGASVIPVAVGSSSDGPKALESCDLVIAAGAPGVVVLPKKIRETCKTLKVAIDLNGVPPTGIEGIELTDKASARDNVITYGALGVGGTKMKVHKAAIGDLFTRNDAILDIDAIYQIAQKID